jgi:hypothetical protein
LGVYSSENATISKTMFQCNKDKELEEDVVSPRSTLKTRVISNMTKISY